METNQLELLARIVLPSEILDYFEITSVEQTSTEIRIHLDELMNPNLSCDVHFESKGFMEAVNVTDFPISSQVDGHAHRQEFQPSNQPGHSLQRNPLLQGVRGFFKRDVWRHPR